MKKIKFKKPYKYQVISTILFIVALLLMILSICPFVYQKLVGILQGLSTGILSGMVLLLITGIKTQEQRKLQKNFDAVDVCIHSLNTAVSSYSTLEQYIFNGSKSSDTFVELLNKISITYSECKNAYFDLNKIDKILIPKDILPDFIHYLKLYKESLNIIEEDIKKAKMNKSTNAFSSTLPAFFTIYNNGLNLFMKMVGTRSNISRQKNKLDDFLF